MRIYRGIALVVLGALAVCADSATASVTVGQVAAPRMTGCPTNLDIAQAAVTSGNSYAVPGRGTITSWSTFGGPTAAQQLTMKIFRAVPGQVDQYEVVGHAGPEPIAVGGTAGNTFPASIAVKSGDLLGFHTATNSNRCYVPGDMSDQTTYFMGDLIDGQANGFTPLGDARLNISATFEPDNVFNVTSTRRNKKRGTATITVELPNPGDLTATGKGARTSNVVGAGPAQLVIKAKGKKRRKLDERGKVKLPVSLTYTPTGGNASSQLLPLVLKKRLTAAP
jgi:hypothetical protein